MATSKDTMPRNEAPSKAVPAQAADKGEEGAAKATGAWEGLPPDSQLISFGDRFTFTFAHGREVGSIHFDRGRGEIFYKGHNIRNMDLEEWQMQILEGLRKTLHHDEQGQTFSEDYGRTLDKVMIEKQKRNS